MNKAEVAVVTGACALAMVLGVMLKQSMAQEVNDPLKSADFMSDVARSRMGAAELCKDAKSAADMIDCRIRLEEHAMPDLISLATKHGVCRDSNDHVQEACVRKVLQAKRI